VLSAVNRDHPEYTWRTIYHPLFGILDLKESGIAVRP
jgi:hypothetical protein